MNWEYTGKFWDSIKPEMRGAVGNEFCLAIREGAVTPNAVIDAIRTKHKERKLEYGETTKTGELLLSGGVLASTHALDFAAFLIEREALSFEEQRRLKTEWEATASVRANAPTEKQLAFLRVLACPDIPKTKAEASELIERYKNGDSSEQRPKADSSRA